MTVLTQTRETRGCASEIKFIIDPATADRVRSWARANLDRDPHGAGRFGDEYDITSLYFDTRDFDVLHRRGSFGRAKYRIRRYGASDTVFLERKLRKDRLLIKRRTEVPIDDLVRLDESDPPREWDGAWFDRRLRARALDPVCQLTYHRLARGLETGDGPARLTLDDAVQAQLTPCTCFEAAEGIRVLPGRHILELKFRGDVPAILRRLVAELRLTPQRASKYRLAMNCLNATGRLSLDEDGAGANEAHATEHAGDDVHVVAVA